MNLYAAFTAAWHEDPARTVLELPGASPLDFTWLDKASAQLAGLLREHGVRPGDRVTVQAPKSPQWLALYLACLRSGAVLHPLNEAYQPAELEFFLDDAAPSLAVCTEASAPLFRRLTGRNTPVLTLDEAGAGSLAHSADAARPLDDIEAVDRDHVAVLLYSSGTTGQPKGAMVTHGNLLSNARTLVASWGFTRDDMLLHALPVYHAHGLFVAVGCALLSGARMLWLPAFDSGAVVGALPRCSVFMGVPTHYGRLLGESALDAALCRHVRLFVSGSAPLPPAVFDTFARRTGHRILERYGLTETGMNTANPLDGERRPGSVGQPLPGIDVRVADPDGRELAPGAPGEVEIRGPNVFAGYWRNPGQSAEAFTQDGWFRTGDQGYFDGEGYLWLVGRSRDLVISGGLNVYPREVELALENLPGVREAAVIGAAHPDYGEGLIAVLVTDADSPDESAVQAALRGRLAGYKLPKRVFFLPGLPRNSMGKIKKNELRQMFADTFSGDFGQ
ncbi:MAG: AMP-binding protein [Chromatiales bacterium]|nr:AMP-binding protein [Chromatiales bacterium]